MKAHCVRAKTKYILMTSQKKEQRIVEKSKKKEKAVLICSRLRERGKKNTEYYVGDY